MARNVRNVWLSFSVDGRGSALEGGPQARDGGFSGRVLLRQNGNIGDSVRIAASPYGEKHERAGQAWMDIEIPASCTVESTPDSDGVTRRMRLSWKL